MDPRLVNRGLKPTGRVMLLTILGVFFGLFLITGISFAQIAHTGMSHGYNLHERALNYQLGRRTVPARRGNILDRDGNVLARQSPAYTMYANFFPDWGSVIDGDNLEEIAYLLSTVIHMSEEDVLANLQRNYNDENIRQSRFGHAGQRLSFLQRRQIEAFNISGIRFIDELVRFHPEGVFASHTIGYTRFGYEPHNYGDLIGAMGLEYYFNDYLTGTDGHYQIQHDRRGIAQPGTERIYIDQPRHGYDISLTISSTIQVFLETAMDAVVEDVNPDNITAIVMNARTGEILAAASRPTFNPNYRNPLSYANDIMYQFEPGSTFKIFTYAAAMNDGVYYGNQTFFPGQRALNAFPLADIIVNDHPLIDRREMTFDEGFWVSTNTSAIDLARNNLGRYRFIDYLHAFGFGRPTGLPLPGEHAGFLPNPATNSTDSYMTAYGQAVSVTPIQLLQATTAIINDGQMIRPQIIAEIFDPNTNQVVQSFEREVVGQPITAATANQMRELMIGVVENQEIGTGRIHYLLDVPSGGKTGTAEVVNPLTGQYFHWTQNVHIYSYIGFAPADNPEIIMFISMKNPTTYTPNRHTYTGQIYRFVMNNTLSYLGFVETLTPDLQLALPEFQREIVPNLLNMTVDEAIAITSDLGFSTFIIGDNTAVFDQMPPADTVALLGDKIFIQTGTIAELPDFTGWTRTQISQFEQLLGLDIRVTGTGVGASQTMRAGRRVRAGDSLTVTLQ